MAKDTPKLLARLTPESTKIVVNGTEILVAGNKEENSTLNKILAAQLRATIQDAMLKYKERDMIPSPKELADLVRAGYELTKMSGEVYQEAEPKNDNKRPEEKNVTGTDPVVNVDFGNLNKPKEDKNGDEKASGVDGK